MKSQQGFGVNVIGFVSSKLGLGTAARMTVASLVKCGVPVAVADVDPGEGRANADLTWQHLFVRDTSRLPHPVNIIHMNPLEALSIRRSAPHLFANTFNAIVPFYELTRVPEQWIPLLGEYHLVLAASEHIAAAIRNAATVPVRRYPLGVELPDVSGATRARFGIPEDTFTFVTTFDTDSGLNRKNALGAIKAFRMAFSPNDDVLLVAKVNGVTDHPELERVAADLGPKRLKLVKEYLPYAEVLKLYAVCDAFVSLHRAEGLGLGLLETMLLGKPVIATGWSGNMDFMDDSCAALVRHTFAPVVDMHPEYGQLRFHETMLWAEPDLAHAASVMNRLYRDAEYRKRIGESAREAAVRRNEQFFGGGALRSLLENFLAWQWQRECGL